MTTDNIYPRPHMERDCFLALTTDSSQSFALGKEFLKDRVLLNAPGSGSIELNGRSFAAGEGIDITETAAGENTLLLKGSFERVWLESVPSVYIRDIHITPFFNEKKVRFDIDLSEKVEVIIEIFAGDWMMSAGSTRCGSCELLLDELYPWSPETPFMYDVMVTAGRDVVKTCFGMRKLGIAKREGKPYFAVNDSPMLLCGTVCTDIAVAKAAGFDLIVAERLMPPEWYYQCDREGLLVWQLSEDASLYSFSCVAIYDANNIKDADTTRLLCCENGDVRRVLRRWRQDGRIAAADFAAKKHRTAAVRAYQWRAARMIKKGLGIALFCGEADPRALAKANGELKELFERTVLGIKG